MGEAHGSQTPGATKGHDASPPGRPQENSPPSCTAWAAHTEGAPAWTVSEMTKSEGLYQRFGVHG